MNQPVVKFLIRSSVVFVLWVVLYQGYLGPQGSWDLTVVGNITSISNRLLDLVGYEMTNMDLTRLNSIRYLQISGSEKAVYVGDECNGLNLFALFTGFILVYPGRWTHKLWFIPTGLIIIHFANIIRVSALAIMQYRAPEWVDFNHTYTFTIIVYSIVFCFWYLWANRFANIKRLST